MKTRTPTLILATSLVAAPLLQSIAAPVLNRTPAFELEVNGKTYDVTEDEPFSIVTPKGETVPMVLKLKELLTFRGQGVTFQYPRTMTASIEEEEDGATSISVESPDSGLILIQTYPEELDLDETIDSFREDIRNEGATFKNRTSTPCRKNIGGSSRTGKALEYTLLTLPYRVEFYQFELNSITVLVMVHAAIEDQKALAPSFKTILESVKACGTPDRVRDEDAKPFRETPKDTV